MSKDILDNAAIYAEVSFTGGQMLEQACDIVRGILVDPACQGSVRIPSGDIIDRHGALVGAALHVVAALYEAKNVRPKPENVRDRRSLQQVMMDADKAQELARMERVAAERQLKAAVQTAKDRLKARQMFQDR